jgi:3-phosphoshikimate 1-carboxyvinyltransferase
VKEISIYSNPSGLRSETELPASKSISNRLLILNELAGRVLHIENLSKADDTLLLINILNDTSAYTIHCENAGTVLRFLSSFFALQQGRKVLLSGSDRMKKRPLKGLIDALSALGADISCTEKEGFPPVEIAGSPIEGGKVFADTSQSSQFVSSLMLIAPFLDHGLEIIPIGKNMSFDYIVLTMRLFKQLNIPCTWDGNSISIPHHSLEANTFFVEADWSAASFFIAHATFYENAELFFPGLFLNSIQGDSRMVEYMKHFGLDCIPVDTGLLVKATKTMLPEYLEINFSNNPDLFLPMLILSVAHHIPCKFTGISHLAYKESDRIACVKKNLQKNDILLKHSGDLISFEGAYKSRESYIFDSYQDHRLAMAFSIMANVQETRIMDPDVVSKSFPGYWQTMLNLGYKIK